MTNKKVRKFVGMTLLVIAMISLVVAKILWITTFWYDLIPLSIAIAYLGLLKVIYPCLDSTPSTPASPLDHAPTLSPENIELKALLDKIASTPDFSYVEFTDINTSNALGDNALHIAVFWEDLAAVKLLVDAGIDINKHGENGHTPLHIACETGNAEIVTYLLEHGADPHARTEGDTPFKTARLNAHDEICDLLNKHFERHPQRGAPSSTSLHLAALQKEIEERCGGHPD